MCSRKYLICVGCLVVSASTLIVVSRLPERRLMTSWPKSRVNQGDIPSHTAGETSPADVFKAPPRRASTSSISLPITLEQNVGQADPGVEYIASGKGMTTLLTGEGIEFVVNGRRGKGSAGAIKLCIVESQASSQRVKRTVNKIEWRGSWRLRAESNYFLWNDPRHWHTHVQHFARAESAGAVPGIGVVLYGSEDKIEYDLRVSPRANLNRVHLAISGAESMRLSSRGDLLMSLADRQVIMGRTAVYSLSDSGKRDRVEGGYTVEREGTVGFRIGRMIRAPR